MANSRASKNLAHKKMQAKMGKVMSEYKEGTLHSGSKKGPVVKSRKQAIAIGMSKIKRGK